MLTDILIYLLFFTVLTGAVRIPFLSDVMFVPISNSTSITVADRSCDECLCQAIASHMVLNCFPNNTCQFFMDVPRIYKIQSSLNALVYFPQQTLPNPSQCCMPDISVLLDRLNNATPTYAPVNDPRCLVLDNHGHLVTVSASDQSIVRFHPNNMTQIDQSPSPVFDDTPVSVAHQDGAYYAGFSGYILIVHSDNMTIIHNISSSLVEGPCDMIFLDDEQQMIASSFYSDRLLFFNRSSPTSHNYDLVGNQTISFLYPRGLFRLSDVLFYLTSYLDITVYIYSKTGIGTE